MSSPHIDSLRNTLEDAWERRADLQADEIASRVRPAVDQAIAGLEQGALRVAEPDGNGGWQVNQWLKKAVLLYFRTQDMALMDAVPARSGTKCRHALPASMRPPSVLRVCAWCLAPWCAPAATSAKTWC